MARMDEVARREAAAARLSAPLEVDSVVRDGRVVWLREGMSGEAKLRSLAATVLSQGMRAVADLGLGRAAATSPVFEVRDWRLVWAAGVSAEARYLALCEVVVGGPASMGAHLGPRSYPGLV